MNIVSGFDPESNTVIINITSNLIGEYYHNLAGLIKNNPSSPQGIEVKKKDENTASVQFPLPKSAMIKKIDDQRAAVSIDLVGLNNIINKAVNDALKYKLRHTEFIPLHGYPIEDLQKDIKAALENKRNFCILKDYQEYLSSNTNNSYRFNQYYVNYGTSEYADVAILIINNEMDELVKLIGPKLRLQDWV